ncbi:hypothetical protein SAMN05660337_2562 [Maridesulfovibrio ferrireducens]|uniref:Uncharacterized protein n=1 Tax=Maridesulfovibrio ferrireducens TaxID=246191 RepID=A0A1G9IXM5_9BACT|nr:hypothetical protein SAMN05660337_2562 [Maridesulfovibrio ferrireducens]
MWGIYSAIKAVIHRKRKCCKCGHRQTIKPADKNRSVKCEKCGNCIPASNDYL